MAFTKRNVLLSVLGLDVSTPAEYIDPRNSPGGQNIFINRNAIHKRIGTTAMGTTMGEEILGCREFLQGTTRHVVRVGLTNIQSYAQASNKWSNIKPFTVGASNKYLDFYRGGSELTATIPEATYSLGTTEADAGSLCKAISDALFAADVLEGTYTVRYASGKITIARTDDPAGAFGIYWKTGTHGSDNADNHIGTLLGYSDAADDIGALTYTADATPALLTGTTSDPISTATPILSGNRVLIISNLIDTIKKYNPVVSPYIADLGGSPPKAKFVQEFGPYLVMANVASYPMRVQWSDTDNIEAWTGGNSGAREFIEDGNDITGLNIFGNYLCVHKESGIYLGQLVSTSEVFSFDRSRSGVGTVCNATIQMLNTGEQVFLARDGIRSFTGSYAPLIESPIQDEIRESLNPKFLHKAWSVVVPELDEYWVGVAIGSQTGPDTIYKFNYKTRQCYKDVRPGTTACGKFQTSSDASWNDDSGTWDQATDRWDDVSLSAQHPTIFFGTNTGESTRRDGSVNNDNGVAINAYRDTMDFEADAKGAMARWLGMQIWAKGNSLTLQYSTDAGTTWTTVGTYTLASDYPTDDAPVWAYFDFVSTKARFRFKNDTLGETFSLKDFQIEYKQREYRR